MADFACFSVGYCLRMACACAEAPRRVLWAMAQPEPGLSPQQKVARDRGQVRLAVSPHPVCDAGAAML